MMFLAMGIGLVFIQHRKNFYPIKQGISFPILPGQSSKKAASVSEGRFAFSGFIYGLGAAGVGAGVGWFGLAWLE